jgi:hypothetical protein
MFVAADHDWQNRSGRSVSGPLPQSSIASGGTPANSP